LFIASLPSYWLIFTLQSFLVRTKISVDNGKYEYISGLLRFRFAFDPEKSFIKIYPYPVSGGDWGLAAKLYVPSIRIRNWVIPFTIVPNHVAAESKWRAVKEAKDIHEWICEKSIIKNVILELKYCRRKRKKFL
ncbi:MAG: hypothetical protein LBD14_02950, partial [Puniceicoccales bacterium]|nr:hypothetical protein [Puniceicoccales bacterium]